MRDFLNKFGIHIVVGILVLAAILAFALRHKPVPTGWGAGRTMSFYVDEETGAESVRAASEIPPLMGKNGKPTVVRAVKYSTGGGRTSQILYLSKYTDEAQTELKSLPQNDSAADFRREKLERDGLLVRAPGTDKPWVAAESKEGKALTAFPAETEGKSPAIINP